jgi:hypothetical protein
LDWLALLIPNEHIIMIAIGTAEILVQGTEAEYCLWSEMNSAWSIEDHEAWSTAEAETVARWTDELPQLSSFHMSYGHDNSLDIELGFDPDSVYMKDVYLERNEEHEWEIPDNVRRLKMHVPWEHPTFTMYVDALRPDT